MTTSIPLVAVPVKSGIDKPRRIAMRFRYYALTLILLASPAASQTTTCQRFGNTVNCFDASAAIRAYQEEQAFRAQREAAEREQALINARLQTEQQARMVALKSESLRKAVGGLLADGDCINAERAALLNGELVLAEQVRSYCKSPTLSSAPSPKPPLPTTPTSTGPVCYNKSLC